MSDDHTLCCSSNTIYVFDKGISTRRIVIFVSWISITFSLCLIFASIGIWIFSSFPNRNLGLLSFKCHVPYEVPSIALNLVVTVCTECAGMMHATSLRFALFRENRITYNSNLRLLTGSDEKSMNSTVINALMTLLLILSYASSSFFYQEVWDGTETPACGVLAIPAIVLGISIFLQTCISLFALRDTEILTWSTSPFDTIPAFLSMHNHQSFAKHYPFSESRVCMCAVCASPVAKKPMNHQPSAWDTRRGVRISIYLLWSLGIACMIWGTWVYIFDPDDVHLWQFIPSPDDDGDIAVAGGATSFTTWFSLYAVMVVTQGGLTLGLHCAELVAGVVRDETIWRQASEDGTNSHFYSWLCALCSDNRICVFCLDNWLYVVLLFAKAFLHWIFGLGVEIWTFVGDGNDYSGLIGFFFAQIFYLGFGVFILATIFTVAARHHPKGAKPATYGHIATILYLVDDWQEIKSWGQKDDGPACHEGTNTEPLLDAGNDRYRGWVARRTRAYV
ncbi:hypothetical protein EDB19DRAFT_1943346 [Suillus lakei]|nr:hypothetical protein EDB19DRAFT_1943346 [Suillus lakei]